MRRFISVSDGREKSFGAPAQAALGAESQIPKGQVFPPAAQIPKPRGPLAGGRFFSPKNSKARICQGHLCIYAMKHFWEIALEAGLGEDEVLGPVVSGLCRERGEV